MRIWPGEPNPLGATYDGSGTNFSLFSEVATKVELCLFDDDGREERIALPEQTAFCWHGYVPGVGPGQRYGYRVHGPWAPDEGQRCNPHKLLLDPYARAVEGLPKWNEALYPHYFERPDEFNDRDSAAHMPRSIVTNPFFDWRDDRRPRTPWHETIVYEAHVKGLTARHPDIAPELRGTYAGLASPPIIEHLKKLGVTAIELLPVHQFVHSQIVESKGLRNYWGYDSIGYFAPHNEYSSTGARGEQVQEFKSMVRAMHAAGIEVLLDVVYNHTAEGNHLGPMLSFKGIDNAAYYRLVADQRRYYMDYTGTGNSLNMRHPHVLQLIMDSLRYWIEEMHVDGFRFDLAATLARGLHEVDRLSAFFDLIQQDPVVSRVKLIAEPWDVGDGGYQVGNFPPLWSEWNGKFRDGVRDYWRGEPWRLGDFAYRLTGSSDLYAETGRRPFASINFVTAHDGFTLRDLVSYNGKHNEANLEENRDGTDDNRSWNCGHEGDGGGAEVARLRAQQQRNFLATLLLSQGVPMLCGGDELGRTQRGNNNGYCQDNELSWFDWEHLDRDLVDFVRRVTKYRQDHRIFRRRRWFLGRPLHGMDVKDLAWFTPEGQEMSDEHWAAGFARSLAVFFSGHAITTTDTQGERVVDDDFFLLFNASHEPVRFVVPDERFGKRWVRDIDTATLGDGTPADPERILKPGDELEVTARSLVVMRRVDDDR
jgi:glycogen operon protein